MIKVNSKEVRLANKDEGKSELDKLMDEMNQKNTVMGSNDKEHSDEELKDREDEAKEKGEDSEEMEDAGEDLKDASDDLNNKVENAEKEREQEKREKEREKEREGDPSGDNKDKGKPQSWQKGGGDKGTGSLSTPQATGFSLESESRNAQLLRYLDEWIKKLIGRPVSKILYDPFKRSRKIPGAFGGMEEEEVPKKGEKVLIVVIDLSGSVMGYAPLMKRTLYNVVEKLAKGKAITKVLLKNFDGKGPDHLLAIPQFKTELRALSQHTTGSYCNEAWKALIKDVKILTRKIQKFSGLVIITDFQFLDNDQTKAYTVPKEFGKLPVFGISIGEEPATKQGERMFFSHNTEKDLRIIRMTDDGKVQRIMNKEAKEEE